MENTRDLGLDRGCDRTTKAIESTFANMRHRTRQTNGCASRKAALSMVFKLALKTEKRWPRLNGHALVAEVIGG